MQEEEEEDENENYFSECIKMERQRHSIDGREVVQEHYRSLREPQEGAQTANAPSLLETLVNQQVNRPNLDVPMEDGSYVTLAQ